jgi:hypothetical protein
MKIDGRCHCGYITYEAEIDPEKVMICHCADCQTLSGFVASPTVGISGSADVAACGEGAAANRGLARDE